MEAIPEMIGDKIDPEEIEKIDKILFTAGIDCKKLSGRDAGDVISILVRALLDSKDALIKKAEQIDTLRTVNDRLRYKNNGLNEKVDELYELAKLRDKDYVEIRDIRESFLEQENEKLKANLKHAEDEIKKVKIKNSEEQHRTYLERCKVKRRNDEIDILKRKIGYLEAKLEELSLTEELLKLAKLKIKKEED